MKDVISGAAYAWRRSEGTRRVLQDFLYGAGEAGWILGYKAMGAAASVIKAVPSAYQKARPFLAAARREAGYVGVNLVGLGVVTVLYFAKGATVTVLFLAKGATLAMGFADGLKGALVEGWRFRSELIAEWE